MRILLAALALALAALLPLTVKANQTGQRASIVPGDPARVTIPGGGVPQGYMIVGETEVPPRGYIFTGLSLMAQSASSEWQAMPSLPVARTELRAVAVGGTIYAVGGFDGDYSSAVEAFDPESGAWTARAPMPTARTRLAVVALGERIYALGGFNGSPLGAVEEYTPATNSWRPCSSMPTPRMMHAAAQVDGKIYAIGGSQDGFVSLGAVEEYDPSTDTWAVKRPIPTARGKLAAVVVGNKIFALGGYNDPLSVEVYDPTTDQWTARSTGPAVYDWAALSVGGRSSLLGATTTTAGLMMASTSTCPARTNGKAACRCRPLDNPSQPSRWMG